MATTKYALNNSAATGVKIPSTGWNDLMNLVDNQVAWAISQLQTDGVLTGWTISAGTNINVAAGEGQVDGAHCKTTGTTAITGLTNSVLNYVYAQIQTPATGRVSESFSVASVKFVANTTGVTPDGAILIATGTTNSDSTNFASVSNTPAGRISLRMPPRLISYTTNATPDTEDTVAHSLGRTPVGFYVISRDKAGMVYNGSTSWDGTNIYLKCNVASTAVKILVF